MIIDANFSILNFFQKYWEHWQTLKIKWKIYAVLMAVVVSHNSEIASFLMWRIKERRARNSSLTTWSYRRWYIPFYTSSVMILAVILHMKRFTFPHYSVEDRDVQLGNLDRWAEFDFQLGSLHSLTLKQAINSFPYLK